MHEFDKNYWEAHWQKMPERSTGREIEVNPYLVRETTDLVAGTALDAGCGDGAEAAWLARRGWRVTAADISAEALTRAAGRAAAEGVDPLMLTWVEADLGTWQPDASFDLVATFYAHPAIPQLAFYERIAEWVAPGGTLLIVGHDHGHHDDHGHHGHDGHHDHHDHHDHGGSLHPPEHATAELSDVVARLDPATWDVVTAEQNVRALANGSGGAVELHDVVLRATRRPLTLDGTDTLRP